ncbi:MAG: hypothetical protein WBG73_14925 [Coleofasciculaceae cyanobacterium]
MQGIQFITDNQGHKIAALVDLNEHREFWADVLLECSEATGFQFLINEQDEKIAVLLDFEKHGEIWEDLYFALITDDLEDEAGVPWEEVKRELESQRKLGV